MGNLGWKHRESKLHKEVHSCKKADEWLGPLCTLKVEKSNDFVWLSEAVICAFVLAFPQRKLLITECKNRQVICVGRNLKSSRSTINLFEKQVTSYGSYRSGTVPKRLVPTTCIYSLDLLWSKKGKSCGHMLIKSATCTDLIWLLL